MTEARTHAVMASELLEAVDRFSDELELMSEQQRLEMRVTGGFGRANDNLRWTAELATAHALAALALALTRDDDEAPPA